MPRGGDRPMRSPRAVRRGDSCARNCGGGAVVDEASEAELVSGENSEATLTSRDTECGGLDRQR